MARPSVAGMFDQNVRIWRPTTERSRLGVEERTYFVNVPTTGAAVNRSTAPESDTGPGLTPTGSRRIYVGPDVDVQPRDLVELLDGPDGRQFWEVDQPPTKPRGHHTQLDCLTWNGTEPTEES